MKSRNSLNPFHDFVRTLGLGSAASPLPPSFFRHHPFFRYHSSNNLSSDTQRRRKQCHDSKSASQTILNIGATSRLITLIISLLLILSTVSLCACSRKALVPRYSEELQRSEISTGGDSIPIDWTIIDSGELQVLAKGFYETGGERHSVYSVGIESCGMRQGTARQMALVRQLFSGFQQVEISSTEPPKWMPAEMSLSRVSASLDGKIMKSIVFSQFFQDCLIEQAFWINSGSRWLHNEKTEKVLFSELKNLPPWSRYEDSRAQSTAEEHMQ